VSITPAITPALAIAALVPVLIGPLPAQSAALTARLCGGGEISIPLGKGGDKKPDCHPKGCHAGTCREKDKSGKLISRKDAM
jgi:hypothetical protein